MTSLSDQELNNYLSQKILPNFASLVDQDIDATLFDISGKALMATNKTATELGFNSYHDLVGMSYDRNNIDLIKKLFPISSDECISNIQICCDIICKVQRFVVEKKRAVTLIDLLPYNNNYATYLSTYFPILHPNGEVVAIETISTCSNIFGFQEYLLKMDESVINTSLFHPEDKGEIPFTKREREVLFLLAHNVTQDHIAQILQISRSTVANLIAQRICPKFGIQGANTKLLQRIALEKNYHSEMPQSLWRPSIIILDQELQDLIIAEQK